jgi:hypothetical protein
LGCSKAVRASSLAVLLLLGTRCMLDRLYDTYTSQGYPSQEHTAANDGMHRLTPGITLK